MYKLQQILILLLTFGVFIPASTARVIETDEPDNTSGDHLTQMKDTIKRQETIDAILKARDSQILENPTMDKLAKRNTLLPRAGSDISIEELTPEEEAEYYRKMYHQEVDARNKFAQKLESQFHNVLNQGRTAGFQQGHQQGQWQGYQQLGLEMNQIKTQLSNYQNEVKTLRAQQQTVKDDGMKKIAEEFKAEYESCMTAKEDLQKKLESLQNRAHEHVAESSHGSFDKAPNEKLHEKIARLKMQDPTFRPFSK